MERKQKGNSRLRLFIFGLITSSMFISVSAIADGLPCNTKADCFGFEVCEDGYCEMPKADWRKGLEFEPRIAASYSVGTQTEESLSGYQYRVWTGFENMGIGGGVGVYTGLRPVPNFGFGLNLGYVLFSDKEGDYLHRLSNAMVEARGYMAYGVERSGFGDIYFSVGIGYLSGRLKSLKTVGEFEGYYGGETDSYERRIWAPVNFKLGVGTTFFFVQGSPRGDVGAGFALDYLIFISRRCSNSPDNLAPPIEVDPSDPDTDDYDEHPYNSSCSEIDGGDLISPFQNLQLSLHLKWVFPLSRFASE